MTTEAVDLIHLLRELPKRQRGRACIVLTRNYLEQKAWAAKLADIARAEHLDLLDELAGSEQTCSMAGFSVEGLFKYLEGRSQATVLLVSGMEFIKATWAYNPGKTMAQFAKQVEMWTREPALLFMIQHDSLLANAQFRRFPDLRFVVDQQNTISL